MRLAVFSLVALCSLFAGCDPISTKRIMVRLPNSPGAQTNAATVTETMLAAKGFEHLQDVQEKGEASLVRCYGKGDVGCKLYTAPDCIRLVVWEFGKSESSAEAIGVRNELRDGLIEKFGKENIRTDDKSN
jgi:hypothetical protein